MIRDTLKPAICTSAWVILGGLCFSADQIRQENQSKFTLHCVIEDAISGLPVKDRYVSVFVLAPNVNSCYDGTLWEGSSRSDKGGRLVFEDLPLGKCIIQADNQGTNFDREMTPPELIILEGPSTSLSKKVLVNVPKATVKISWDHQNWEIKREGISLFPIYAVVRQNTTGLPVDE